MTLSRMALSQVTIYHLGERKWVERNWSNRPPVPWVESSPFRNWVEWTWVDLEKCQVQERQHIDFDTSPFDPIRPQSIRPKLFDQKGRPNSFRPISFDPFHAILTISRQRFAMQGGRWCNFRRVDRRGCQKLIFGKQSMGGRKLVEGTGSKIRVSPQVDIPNF